MTKRTADLLRMRLAELQWTQQQLADGSGVSQSHMSQILAGHRHIYLDQLSRMCEVMGIRLRDVIGEAESARDALLDEVDERTGPPVHGRSDKTRGTELDSDIA